MVRIPVREGKKKIPDLKLSHTVLRYRPVRGDWCTGGWSHRWVRSGGSTSEGDFLGSLTGGTWVALPVSPTSDYTEHPFPFYHILPIFFCTSLRLFPYRNYLFSLFSAIHMSIKYIRKGER